PTQIQAKLDKDPVFWEAKIQALRNAALEVVEVAKKKDVNALFEASEDVDQACEACHLEYWYPGDAAAVREWKNGKVRYGT
ncbi:cytochrome c, partial [Escherichia coli]